MATALRFSKMVLRHHRNAAPGTRLFNLNRLLLFFCFLLWGSGGISQTLPQGFTTVQVTAGLNSPTALAFAPDGRIFITQQNGVIRVFKNGALLPTNFMTVSVQASGERGLVGIALDPNFSSNGFMYLCHTLPDGSRNRVIRVRANGDVVEPGSTTFIFDFDQQSSATNHIGGALHFGPDGKLYLAAGDNGSGSQSQSLDTYHGKLLRINPDGSIPSNNPFGSTGKRAAMWAIGLRNPYTFGFQPGTGKLFVNDVGFERWEEVNDVTSGGKNFGWPLAEGMSTNTDFTNPVYTYAHGAGDGVGCAITGGTFFSPAKTNYPAQYKGGYFFLDYCNKWINFLSLSGTPARQSFATDLQANALYLSTGNDGNLYYLTRGPGTLMKIVYTATTMPAITQQPASITVAAGQPAKFSVTASGTAPLAYQWFKNGSAITGATNSSFTINSVEPGDAGNYTVRVSNSAGNVTSNAAALTVSSFNTRPTAQILTPAAGVLYRAGQTISFSGSATDAQDGTLPASAFTWLVDFHHDEHTHDGPELVQGAKSGSFVIPTSNETSDNVWYRLILVVEDKSGLRDTVYRDIYPHKSVINLRTQPAGLQLTLDGSPVNTPLAVTSVEGIERIIGSLAPQVSGFKVYEFDRWAHGGDAAQTIATPIPDTTFTGIYRESPFSSSLYEAEQALTSGANIRNQYPGFTGSGYVDYFNKSNDFIEWRVTAAASGSHNIGFRYALQSGVRYLRVEVNGVVVNPALNFNGTGSFATWAYQNIAAELVAGVNTIRLVATGNSGPNVDHILVTPQLLEAEYALASGASLSAAAPNFTGTGYLNFRNLSGDYIEWVVYKNVAGPTDLSFRYVQGGTSQRPMRIQVNGAVVQDNYLFPLTPNWSNWSTVSITANLDTGFNRIRLTSISNDGPNVDHLQWRDAMVIVSPGLVKEKAAPVLENSTALKVQVVPNPAVGNTRLLLQRKDNLPVRVLVVGAEGKVFREMSVVPGAGNGIELSLAGYPAGMYTILAIQGNERASTLLLVQ